MKPSLFAVKKIGAFFTLLIVALSVGCVLPQNGGLSGPAGVVEMDDNTDPRFFLNHRQGAIGRLKIAGSAVWLNGKRLPKDTALPNGAHVRTGPASAAIIDFYSAGPQYGRLDIRDFRRGRLYGQAKKCAHAVATDQGVMETRGWPASYHAEIPRPGISVFTAIDGEAMVWRHDRPGEVVRVPGFHQVVLSPGRISPPRPIRPGEVETITRWRENFWRWREQAQVQTNHPPSLVSVPDLRKREVGDAGRMLDHLKLNFSVSPSGAGSRDRILRQEPPPGTEVKPGTTVRVYVRTEAEPVTVPNLVSKSLAEARSILSRLGLGLRYTPRNPKEQYWVYRQSPAPGSRVARGTVVNLTLQAPIY